MHARKGYRLGLFLIALANLLAPPGVLAAQDYPPVMPPKQAEFYKRAQGALDSTTKLEFVEVPLQEVVDYLSELHRISIQLDFKSMMAAGISSDVPITRNLKDLSLRSALNNMLGEVGLTSIVRDEAILITTKQHAAKTRAVEIYDLESLLTPERRDPQAILAAIRLLAPEAALETEMKLKTLSWLNDCGVAWASLALIEREKGALVTVPRRMVLIDKKLVLDDSLTGHKEVQRFLGKLAPPEKKGK